MIWLEIIANTLIGLLSWLVMNGSGKLQASTSTSVAGNGARSDEGAGVSGSTITMKSGRMKLDFMSTANRNEGKDKKGYQAWVGGGNEDIEVGISVDKTGSKHVVKNTTVQISTEMVDEDIEERERRALSESDSLKYLTKSPALYAVD